MNRADAIYIRKAMADFFNVPESSSKILTLGEGEDKESVIFWSEIDATTGKKVTKTFSDRGECIAYLTSSDGEVAE